MVKIMSGMQFDEIDAFVASAVSEIANIISGNVLTALSGENLNYNLLPPVQSNSDDKEYENGKSCCIDTSIGDVSGNQVKFRIVKIRFYRLKRKPA